MLTDKYISVVVICYRDEGSIDLMLSRLQSTLEKITPNWEVIYVNDHSPDDSERALLEKAAKLPWLTVISHSRNFGAQTAFSTGMAQAGGDAVVIMDGDLQDPPEMIEGFVAKWLEGYDVVYGIRAKRHEGFIRNVGYKLFYRVFKKISYIDVPLDAGEFSLMDRVVVDSILKCEERDRLIRGLRAFAGFKQTGIAFERMARYSGESTQSLYQYLHWVVTSFSSFSLAPLRLISFMAFVMAILSLATLLFFLTMWLFGGKTPQGFMTIISLLLSISAMIMISLGIISEYLGRLFLEIKRRPQQIISLLVNDHRKEPRNWLGRKEARVEGEGRSPGPGA